MQKNDYVTGDIISYGCEGEGIMKTDGCTVFVPFTCKGEKVRVKILKVKGQTAYGKIEEVICASPKRVKPQCKVFGKCGGCNLMHMSYAEQLEYKKELIENTLRKIGFLNVNLSEGVVASTPEIRYRNKLQLPVGMCDNGVIGGFYASNSHRIVSCDDCLLNGVRERDITAAVKEYMTENGVSAYDETSGKGVVRHIVVKRAGDEYLIILVVNGTEKALKNMPALINKLNFLFCGGEKYGLFVNLNSRRDNVILGEKFIKICGESVIHGNYGGINYEVGALSFMQVNSNVMRAIYDKAASFVCGGDYLIDAYCGAGVLTCALAKKCESALGIEIVDEAVKLARETAEKNNVKNAEFICAPCENVLPEIIKERRKKGLKTTLLLDPPRKGLDFAVSKAVKESLPDKIIYISCSPQTLARDLGIIFGTLEFTANGIEKAADKPVNAYFGEILPSGYTLEYISGFDMFAQCKGVETLAVLTR